AGALRLAGPLALTPGSTVATRGVLRVDGAVRGEGLLLSGARVEVEGAVDAQAEIVARRSVRLARGVRLRYPSTIFAALETGGETDRIEIASATVEGTVVVPESELGGPAAVRLEMAPEARVVGAVLSLSTADVEGRIDGTLFARRFRFFSSPAVFVNWLRDVTVDARARPEDFVVPVGVGEGTPSFVVVRRGVRSSFVSPGDA
ncbi:MAG: hypothetical protein AAFQ43_11825, partial [Bacteroidota bacterium]